MSVIKPTHSISLHVQVGDPEQLKQLRERFGRQLLALPDDLPYSNMTVFNLDGIDEDNDGGEFYDDNTLDKVRNSLLEAVAAHGYSKTLFVNDLIHAMQSAGILFRERRPVQ